jgi:hypothetical protein
VGIRPNDEKRKTPDECAGVSHSNRFINPDYDNRSDEIRCWGGSDSRVAGVFERYCDKG